MAAASIAPTRNPDEVVTQPEPEQSGFAFPQPLAEKYRPRRIADFVGLEKVKKIMGRFAA